MSDLSKEELEARIKSSNIRDFDIGVITDRAIGIQLTKLLAYIRHAIKNNEQRDITVRIGRNVQNADFSFMINDQEIKDLICQDIVEIN